MKKIIIAASFLCLLSFNTKTDTVKNKIFQATQVQTTLREELYWIYIDNPTLENKSNHVDALYVETLLKEILNDTI
jgi:hypothetical protein